MLEQITSMDNTYAIGRSCRHDGDAGNVHRSRHALNADTIREMHLAFRRGGRKAIDRVMKTQPAVFLKLLVLLVPRELQVEHKGGVKAMERRADRAGHRGYSGH